MTPRLILKRERGNFVLYRERTKEGVRLTRAEVHALEYASRHWNAPTDGVWVVGVHGVRPLTTIDGFEQTEFDWIDHESGQLTKP